MFTPTAPSFVGSDRRDPGFAYLFGQDLGHILADQHACVPSPDLDGWLPPTPNWPRPEDLPHLHHMVHDSELLRGIDLALERRADLKWPDDRRVLIHGDLDRDQVLLLNAVAAIGFLAFRHGHSPDESWCGRTLVEDLAWTRAALSRAGL